MVGLSLRGKEEFAWHPLVIEKLTLKNPFFPIYFTVPIALKVTPFRVYFYARKSVYANIRVCSRTFAYNNLNSRIRTYAQDNKPERMFVFANTRNTVFAYAYVRIRVCARNYGFLYFA